MKMALKIIGVVAGLVTLVVVVPVVIIAVSFARTMPIQDGFEPVPGIRTVRQSFVSVFIVDIGPGRVVLVDAGMDPKAGKIISELARRNLKPESVQAILLTHGHGDHLGGVKAFPKASIYVLEGDVPLVEGKVGSRNPMGRFFSPHLTGIKVTKALRDGETVKVGRASFRYFSWCPTACAIKSICLLLKGYY